MNIAAGDIPVCHADAGKQSQLGIVPACLTDEDQRQAIGCDVKKTLRILGCERQEKKQ